MGSLGASSPPMMGKSTLDAPVNPVPPSEVGWWGIEALRKLEQEHLIFFHQLRSPKNPELEAKFIHGNWERGEITPTTTMWLQAASKGWVRLSPPLEGSD